MNRWTSAAFAGVGLGLIVAQLLVPPGPLRGAIYQAMLWGCVAAVLTGVRRHRPPHPRAWALLAAGVALLAAAALLDPRFSAAVPTPGTPLAEVMGPLGYVLIGCGAVLFARAQSGGRDRGPILDSVLVMLALTAMLWEVALARGAAIASDPTYLPSILVMSAAAGWVAAMTVRVLLSGGHRVLSGWLLLGSSLAGCAGSVIWAYQWVQGGLPSRLTLGAWSLALLLLGASALHPSMRRLTAPADVETAHTISRVLLPALALLVPPTAMLGRQLTGGGTSTIAAVSALLIGVVVVLRFADLVADRERARQALQHQSLHDPLTGLPNRALVHQRLSRALHEQVAPACQVGVCFIDLDRFKAINDAHGHAAGDQVLVAVADRLRERCLPEHTVGRFAGDEFVLVAPRSDPASLMTLAGRLRQDAREPIVLADGTTVRVDASVGVVLAGGMADPDGVLSAADKAMYVAKRKGQGGVALASPDVGAGLQVDR